MCSKTRIIRVLRKIPQTNNSKSKSKSKSKRKMQVVSTLFLNKAIRTR